MTTQTQALADIRTTDEQSLVRPANRREEILTKLNSYKCDNLNARQLKEREVITEKMNLLFTVLSWSKFGVSPSQLKKMHPEDLEELATMVYERTRMPALVHTGMLACFPVVGWFMLGVIIGNPSSMYTGHPVSPAWRQIRYFWYYRRILKRYSKPFQPTPRLDWND